MFCISKQTISPLGFSLKENKFLINCLLSSQYWKNLGNVENVFVLLEQVYKLEAIILFVNKLRIVILKPLKVALSTIHSLCHRFEKPSGVLVDGHRQSVELAQLPRDGVAVLLLPDLIASHWLGLKNKNKTGVNTTSQYLSSSWANWRGNMHRYTSVARLEFNDFKISLTLWLWLKQLYFRRKGE